MNRSKYLGAVTSAANWTRAPEAESACTRHSTADEPRSKAAWPGRHVWARRVLRRSRMSGTIDWNRYPVAVSVAEILSYGSYRVRNVGRARSLPPSLYLCTCGARNVGRHGTSSG